MNAQTPILTLAPCPDDITVDNDNFSWNEPTASTTCFTGEVTVEQVGGPANGSTPEAGTYEIIYLINDDCGNSEVCIFTVTVNAGETGCPTVGDPCDDGDDCTTGDVFDENCNCAGTFQDSDNDGICDADDICEGGDDNVDSDGNGTPDFCDNDVCDNFTNGGLIEGDEIGCTGYDPSPITSAILPSGGSGEVEYLWLSSTTGCPNSTSQAIPGAANGPSYDPGPITQTTYFLRCSRRAGCTVWIGESNCIVKTVDESDSDGDGICDSQDDDMPSACQDVSEDISGFTFVGEYNNSKYYVSNNTKNWNNAKAISANAGGHLVVVNNQGENNFIRANVAASRIWIGYTDVASEGNFVWVTGENSSYTNWNNATNEPNNWNNVEHHTEMLASGKWNDKKGSVRRKFVMEIPCVSSSQNLVSASEIFDFRAYKNGRGVRTIWITDTEQENDYFILERSYDGVTFQAIGSINSISNESGAFNYMELDSEPSLGDNYYRLTKIHYDGTIKHSTVRKVRFDIDLDETTLFPNPATKEVYLDLDAFAGRSATITIYNHLGQQMDVEVIEEVEETLYRFDVSNYMGGAYTMYIEMEGTKNFAKKFIISKL